MLNPRELATILAALRYWQQDLDEDSIDGGEHFSEQLPLSAIEIDALCERLNLNVSTADKETAAPDLVICVADGAVQAVYASQADLQVSIIDWDADPDNAHFPGVGVIECAETTLGAYVTELTTDSLASLTGGDAEMAIRAAQAKAAAAERKPLKP